MKLIVLPDQTKFQLRCSLRKLFIVIASFVLLSPYCGVSAEASSVNGVVQVSLVIGAAKLPQKTRSFMTGSHLTWGAAEISVLNAGYVVKQRLGSSNDTYWFNAANLTQIVKIGVSKWSGEIVSVSQ